MDCNAFLALPADTGGRDDDEGDAWRAHLASCRSCEDHVLAERVRERGHSPADFPCVHLAFHATHVCANHADPMECPDATVVCAPRFREWGLPIRDAEGVAATYVVIRHCPWCAAAVPSSLRSDWHAELARLGFRNPLAAWDELPGAFKTDAWWRER